MKFTPHSIRDLADMSAKLMHLLRDDPAASALALSDMMEAADLFFCVLPDGSTYVIKGREVLCRLQEKHDLDQKVELAAIHVANRRAVELLSQCLGQTHPLCGVARNLSS